MRDGKLSIREVEVVFRDAQYVYLSSGLENGDAVVTSNLSRIREGAELRLQEEAQ